MECMNSRFLNYGTEGGMTLGENLRRLRDKKQLQQKELAAAVGISPSALCNYENGDREPSLEVVGRLADALDVTIDALLGREQPQTAEAVRQ